MEQQSNETLDPQRFSAGGGRRHALASLLRGVGRASPEPHAVLAHANEELCRDNPHSMFATAFLAMLDVRTGELRFCGAGHPMPYVLGDAGVASLDSPRGTPLGICPTHAYHTSVRTLAPGETLFLFTDGITEALDADSNLFLEGRLKQTLESAAGSSAKDVVAAVLRAVRQFVGPTLQSDDIAALAVRMLG